MFSSLEKKSHNSITELVRTRVDAGVRSLSGAVTFLDELYRTIANRIETIIGLTRIRKSYALIDDLVDTRVFRHLEEDTLRLSEACHTAIPELYERANTLANDIITNAEELGRKLSICDQFLKEAEGNLKREVNLKSVKDEVIVYDDFRTAAHLTGDLAIDRRTGYASLGIVSSENVPFTIASVDCTVPKGRLGVPAYEDDTWKSISNGYFVTRTFATNPTFETAADIDPTRMVDGDVESAYGLEYNTRTIGEPFRVRVALTVPAQNVDQIVLTVDPPSAESTLSPVTGLPYLSRFNIWTETEAGDIASGLIDKRVVVDGNALGKIARAIEHRESDLFPTASYFINRRALTQVNIELALSMPQEAYYLEKIIASKAGFEMHRLNYFETLCMNNYDPPAGRLDPRSFYTRAEFARMERMVAYGAKVYDVKMPLYRYYIGLKEIALKRFVFKSTSEGVTGDLNTSGRAIAAVEVFARETVPAGTDIRYYVSPDKIVWYELSPRTRYPSDFLPGRVVFGDIDTREGDLTAPAGATALYFRVFMSGANNVAPVLHAYAVRIKLQ